MYEWITLPKSNENFKFYIYIYIYIYIYNVELASKMTNVYDKLTINNNKKSTKVGGTINVLCLCELLSPFDNRISLDVQYYD